MLPKQNLSRKAAGNGNELEDEDLYPELYIDDKWHNLRTLSEEVAKCQRQQEAAAKALPNLIKQYIALLEAGSEQASRKWRGKRVTQMEEFTKAQRNLEDFLYFQNAIHRRLRLGNLWTAEQKKKATERQDRSGQLKLPITRPYRLMDHVHGTLAGPLLDHYDNLGYGTPAHRHGKIDGLEGKPVSDADANVPTPVRLRYLHLWTPASRRTLEGVPYEERLPFERNEPILDVEGILNRWREVEERPDETPGVEYRSHMERRIAQHERYSQGSRPSDNSSNESFKETRPSTSQIVVKGKVTEDRFRRIQIGQGLFISALESSYDWRTSYDCLGPVKPGITMDFEVSDIRTSIERPPQLEEGEGNDIESRDEDRNQEATQPRKKAVAKKSKSRKSKGKNTATPVMPATPVVVTDIDYPHEAREFARPSKKLQVGVRKDAPISTAWAEETTGRRERHAYMRYSPSSGVDSPPHLPIEPDEIADDSIPAGFSLTQERPIPITPQHKKRCKHNPNHCRLWWSPDHPVEECWIPNPEQPRRSDDPVQWPLLDIDAPKDNPDDYLPSQVRDIYRSRLYDHYGLRHNLGPEEKEPRWPKIGIRVPYEPMTFDDLRMKKQFSDDPMDDDVINDPTTGRTELCRAYDEPNPPVQDDCAVPQSARSNGKIVASNARWKAVHEILSMAVPIIEQPQTAWGWFPTDFRGRDANGDAEGDSDEYVDEESDDEGDVFKISYEECSKLRASSAPPRNGDLDGSPIVIDG